MGGKQGGRVKSAESVSSQSQPIMGRVGGEGGGGELHDVMPCQQGSLSTPQASHHRPPSQPRYLCPFCRYFSAKKDFAALVRSLPLEVMMPVNSGLTLMLPTSGCTERQHQPFAEVVTIADIKDEVELLPSLQKPKKVCLLVYLPSTVCCFH